MDLHLLVALLNSKLLDWYFRLGSTNSKVNEYQFNALPIPAIMGTEESANWEEPLKQRDWEALEKSLSSLCNEA